MHQVPVTLEVTGASPGSIIPTRRHKPRKPADETELVLRLDFGYNVLLCETCWNTCARLYV